MGAADGGGSQVEFNAARNRKPYCGSVNIKQLQHGRDLKYLHTLDRVGSIEEMKERDKMAVG